MATSRRKSLTHHEPDPVPVKSPSSQSPSRNTLANLHELLIQIQSVAIELSKAAQAQGSQVRPDHQDIPSGNTLMSVDISEAAARLNISRTTAYSLMEQGRLRYAIVGNRRRIPLAELERVLALPPFAA